MAMYKPIFVLHFVSLANIHLKYLPASMLSKKVFKNDSLRPPLKLLDISCYLFLKPNKKSDHSIPISLRAGFEPAREDPIRFQV